MTRMFSTPIAAALVAMTAAPLAAQTLFAPGRDEVEPGQPYVSDTFTDWDLRCIRSPEDDIPERCEMFQLLRDSEDNAVAVMRLDVPFAIAEGDVASMTILTPLETLLPPGVRVQIDEDGEAAAIPFTLCDRDGCMARASLGQDDVDNFQAGADAFITIGALTRDELGGIGGVPVDLTASLRGFTAAYDEMQARHEEVLAFLARMQAAAGEGGDE